MKDYLFAFQGEENMTQFGLNQLLSDLVLLVYTLIIEANHSTERN